MRASTSSAAAEQQQGVGLVARQAARQLFAQAGPVQGAALHRAHAVQGQRAQAGCRVGARPRCRVRIARPAGKHRAGRAASASSTQRVMRDRRSLEIQVRRQGSEIEHQLVAAPPSKCLVTSWPPSRVEPGDLAPGQPAQRVAGLVGANAGEIVLPGGAMPSSLAVPSTAATAARLLPGAGRPAPCCVRVPVAPGPQQAKREASYEA